MATRCLVGIQDGPDHSVLRFVMNEGMPTNMGPQMVATWHHFEGDFAAFTSYVLQDERPGWWSVFAAPDDGGAWNDGDGEVVELLDLDDDTDAEWAYLGTPQGLLVLLRLTDRWHSMGCVPWNLSVGWRPAEWLAEGMRQADAELRAMDGPPGPVELVGLSRHDLELLGYEDLYQQHVRIMSARDRTVLGLSFDDPEVDR